MIAWHTHCLWIFKVSGLNCFFLLNLCLYVYRSCSWNRKKKITDDDAKCVFLTVNVYPSPEVFLKEHRKVYFIKCRFLIVGRKRF
jgi:hypothetical protein